MIEINYTPQFIKKYKKIKETDLKKEVKTKIELFKKEENHKNLEVHKLNGYKSPTYAFSVNYRDRVVFEYKKGNKKEVNLLSFGSHNVYKK